LSCIHLPKKAGLIPGLFYFYGVQRKEPKLTPAEARLKIYWYCAYQERCHQEVRAKLIEYGLSRGDVDELIADLITEGYLNEERFAKAFAGGKFRMKKWGRIKIEHELERKGLTPGCIRAGLREIDEVQYLETLRQLLLLKSGQIDAENEFVRKDKLASYAIQKGYEAELVWRLLKESQQR
jgi:regulatory protein